MESIFSDKTLGLVLGKPGAYALSLAGEPKYVFLMYVFWMASTGQIPKSRMKMGRRTYFVSYFFLFSNFFFSCQSIRWLFLGT